MMIVKKLVEWRLVGETEVLGENLPSASLSTTNPTWLDPGLNPGRRGGKPATNRLSYGAALVMAMIAMANFLKICEFREEHIEYTDVTITWAKMLLWSNDVECMDCVDIQAEAFKWGPAMP
jgi:hypothetical protein